jgi:serine protease
MYNSFIGTNFYGGEARDEVHNRVTGSGGVLTNGVPETGLGASTGGELRYTLDVPAGATNLVFTTTGSDPDADLYVKFGSEPTTSSFDCRSWTSSSNETCNIGTAQAGTYHVLVYAYSTFANLTLTGSYTEPGSCSYYDATSSLSGSSGSWSYYSVGVPSCASTLTVQISGGSGDADLYVKLGSQPSSSSFDCRPYLWGNDETCTFTPPQAGTYYIGLHGYSSYSGVTLEVDYQ